MIWTTGCRALFSWLGERDVSEGRRGMNSSFLVVEVQNVCRHPGGDAVEGRERNQVQGSEEVSRLDPELGKSLVRAGIRSHRTR